MYSLIEINGQKLVNVRFAPKNGLFFPVAECPLRAKVRHCGNRIPTPFRKPQRRAQGFQAAISVTFAVFALVNNWK
jgi:hypothetical protein